jgi:hypothetical protein
MRVGCGGPQGRHSAAYRFLTRVESSTESAGRRVWCRWVWCRCALASAAVIAVTGDECRALSVPASDSVDLSARRGGHESYVTEPNRRLFNCPDQTVAPLGARGVPETVAVRPTRAQLSPEAAVTRARWSRLPRTPNNAYRPAKATTRATFSVLSDGYWAASGKSSGISGVLDKSC